jgi:crotonobetainyl-CoA:carnitine CoA-transferase CaiB-like acyl-CoA transferase
VDKLNAIGLFAQPLQDHAELAADPQVLANGYIHELQRDDGPTVRVASSGLIADDEPVRVRRVAPHHGEHTEEVLLESGYTWDEITRLRDDGIVGPAHRAEASRT